MLLAAQINENQIPGALRQRAARLFTRWGIQTLTPAGRWFGIDLKTFSEMVRVFSPGEEHGQEAGFIPAEAGAIEEVKAGLERLYGTGFPPIENERQARSARLHLLFAAFEQAQSGYSQPADETGEGGKRP